MTKNRRLRRAIRQYEFITVMYVTWSLFVHVPRKMSFTPRKVQRALNHSERFTYVGTYARTRITEQFRCLSLCVGV